MKSGLFCSGLILSLIAFVYPASLLAQSGAANGSIRGRVHDPAGAAVANAKAGAKNLETGYERSAVTDQQGEFELPLLPLGRYEVEVAAPGFASYQQSGVRVELSRSSDLEIRLALASAQQSLTVQADASILTTSSSDISGGKFHGRAVSDQSSAQDHRFKRSGLNEIRNGSRDILIH